MTYQCRTAGIATSARYSGKSWARLDDKSSRAANFALKLAGQGPAVSEGRRRCRSLARIGIIHGGRLVEVGALSDLRAKLAPGGSLEEIFIKVTSEREPDADPSRAGGG